MLDEGLSLIFIWTLALTKRCTKFCWAISLRTLKDSFSFDDCLQFLGFLEMLVRTEVLLNLFNFVSEMIIGFIISPFFMVKFVDRRFLARGLGLISANCRLLATIIILWNRLKPINVAWYKEFEMEAYHNCHN